MTKEDRARMTAFGIRRVPKNVYYYREFKYDSLDDALRYAEIDAGRGRDNDAGS